MATATLPPGSLQRMVRPRAHDCLLRKVSAVKTRTANAQPMTAALAHPDESSLLSANSMPNNTKPTTIRHTRGWLLPGGCEGDGVSISVERPNTKVQLPASNRVRLTRSINDTDGKR